MTPLDSKGCFLEKNRNHTNIAHPILSKNNLMKVGAIVACVFGEKKRKKGEIVSPPRMSTICFLRCFGIFWPFFVVCFFAQYIAHIFHVF